MITEAEAVSNGIQWLNENGPADWLDKVDPSNMDVRGRTWSGGAPCVLEQVYGLWMCRPEEFRYVDAQVTHGFQVSASGDYEADYEALTTEWQRALAELKA